MIVGENTKSIVFYGDSLVYGRKSGENARLSAKERFCGVLQELLGEDFDIISEGLRARNLIGENPNFSDRDGFEQFGPIIGSHLPVDLLVLFLGTNDCNNRKMFDAQKIAFSLSLYEKKLAEWTEIFQISKPKILVVLPPDIDETKYDDVMKNVFGAGASSRIKKLRIELEKQANKLDMHVFDSSKVCVPAIGDGIHLDVKNNISLAKGLEKEIRKIMK